ncbi:hypothetical protein JCM14469_02540 [Desulfatiferula olefinivorans]|uniref:7-cyano-7-deazaguanine synthase n=1 Tax=Syntrophorhabdus aromaticivorans TaxID=328301 RepID=A0A971RZR2_9BACT|nr:hypothetical protein [Syntrophorhabdus aromaticivorans]
MANERSILCGDVSYGNLPFGGDNPLCLHLWGVKENVSLSISDIREHLLRDLPSQFHDLIEIATYVYCADQAVTRGGDGVQNFGADWRRRLFFRIPVRNPDLWNSSPLKEQLIATLSFLSEDEYYFDFVKLTKQPPTQQHLEFDFALPEEVVLFSGGLDSLGGAIHEAVVNKRKIALVMHKPTHKLARRHRKLQELLEKHSDTPPLHIPVSINKAKSLGREYTQRSRSFLYAALGSTVAQMFNLSRIRFYENGVVSFNLPPSSQVVGARATRTTHPQVISGFAKIISILAGKPFVVENPFLWKTKTEILKGIGQSGCAEMIKFATSCTHTWEMTRLLTHCGTCSQCIDRRFAVLSAGLEGHDPAEAYGVDLLVGERPAGDPFDDNRKHSESRIMLAAYVETASDVCKMSPIDFFSRYGEAARVLRHIDGSADSAALRLFELHKRHAKAVSDVIDQSIANYASAIRKRELPDSCLLRLVCDSAISTSGVIGVPTSTPIPQDELKDFVFRKKGQAWIARYAGGEDFILLPCKGAAYLHILLSNPKTVFSVTDLVLRVAKAPQQFQLGSAGEAADQDAFAAYRVRYEELKEKLAEAQNYTDQGMAPPFPESDIRQEMVFLAEQIKKDKGLGKRIRNASDDRDRVRKAFQANIRRVTKEIAKYDRRLAEHLKSPRLRCGWSPCYDPHDDIPWDI